ncbi:MULTISPECIES: carboxymuconolactone decarboxylase family protein [unclassified Pseudoclavibacter]|uniref:carboxymuconolactone decarboxylase family protein n=1 Tax=unclassified Pseudoclavibacter TaxID=2615177 RepID=UPI000CE802D1|nr:MULTISPECIES: carboxymuconolactone decarboxylase family protein [unclassified Pseudoclavibacter]PPF37075.1 carboxymuconolactone decarboxylase [Pseudoclavibacter sp. AY1H1]PPF78496.1 carboxymuconolactone decarboxylase [Pseudoclavibacter sp. Z016]PPG01864.1 carboxymuconolactone decarboxylase [Pseudoclavibacter sp. RFBI5]
MDRQYDPEAGLDTLAALQEPETTQGWRTTVDATAPGFDEWIVGAVFGGTYQRPGLSPRDRQLLNLGALAALGGVDPQLQGQIASSIRIGMSREEVAEAFVHLVAYVGLPRTMAALRALDTVSPNSATA